MTITFPNLTSWGDWAALLAVLGGLAAFGIKGFRELARVHRAVFTVEHIVTNGLVGKVERIERTVDELKVRICSMEREGVKRRT